jgi:N12 class adenine-specific DNA methylase
VEPEPSPSAPPQQERQPEPQSERERLEAEIEKAREENNRLKSKQIAQLEAENQALREKTGEETVAPGQEQLQAGEEEVPDAEGAVRAGAAGAGAEPLRGGTGRVPEGALPVDGERPEGEGAVSDVPAGEGDAAPRDVRAGDREGPGSHRVAGAGDGRVLPGAGEGVVEPRADGSEAVVTPAAPPAPRESQPRSDANHRWKQGELEETERRSWREKAKGNLAAIQALKSIEAAGRQATADERRAIAQYVGWGALKEAFDGLDYADWEMKNSSEKLWWGNFAKELKGALTPEEWMLERTSVLNAHHTGEYPIRQVWATLRAMGLPERALFLEPSAGIGNFVSAAGGANPRATMIELSSIPGRMLKLLFPTASTYNQGFETTRLPRDYYDVVGSNVPFGNYSIADPEYSGTGVTGQIHNYFLARMVDQAHPGGLVFAIASHGTMDAKTSATRAYVAERAWLVGAVRLPNTAFQRNAGTGVTTDLLFFRKKTSPGEEMPTWAVPPEQWVETTTTRMHDQYGGVHDPSVSPYFRTGGRGENNVIGEWGLGGTASRNELVVEGPWVDDAKAGDAVRQKLEGTLQRIAARTDIYQPAPRAARETAIASTEEITANKPKSLALRDGKPARMTKDGTWEALGAEDFPTSDVPLLRAWLPLRDAAREVIRAQVQEASDKDLAAAQRKMASAYDAFVRNHGYLHDKRAARSAVAEDPEFPLTVALESWTPPETRREGRRTITIRPGKGEKSAIFTKRTITSSRPAEKADSLESAYAVALGEKGFIDAARVGQLLSTTEDEARTKLLASGLVFEDPVGGELTPKDLYLSGNVRQRLKEAQAAAANDPKWAPNVAALQGVQPVDLTAEEVRVDVGAPWVDPSIMEDFAYDVLLGHGAGSMADARGRLARLGYGKPPVSIKFAEAAGLYSLTVSDRTRRDSAGVGDYSTEDFGALDLLEKALNMRRATVYYPKDRDGNGGGINEEATALAQMKLEAIKEKFAEWVWSHPRAKDILDSYNWIYNAEQLRVVDGSHLTFPGMNRGVLRSGDLEPHQKNDVWRILTQRNTLIGEPVGSGKTWTLVAAAMEARRTGIARKPMLAMPTSLVDQWAAEWRLLYPHAKLLTITSKELQSSSRAEMTARIATEDWDAVLISHTALKSIGLGENAYAQIAKEDTAIIDEAFAAVSDDADLDPDAVDVKALNRSSKVSREDKASLKKLLAMRERVAARLKQKREGIKRDSSLDFEALGVDMLLVDESHAFNNLWFHTKLGRMKGLSAAESDRAADLYEKTRTIQRMGGRVVFATATPLRNTMAEMFTAFRFLSPQFLADRKLRHFDSWVHTFGRANRELESTTTGSGMRWVTSFSRFVNAPELLRAFRSYSAIMKPEDLNLPTPKLAINSKGRREPEVREVATPDGLKGFNAELDERIAAIQRGNVDPKDDNMLAVTTEARKAAIDLTLVGMRAQPEEGSKLSVVRDILHDRWKRHATQRLASVAFLDTSVPRKDRFSAYVWLRDQLVARGVPPQDIAFSHDYPGKRRRELFEKMNRGEVRILIAHSAHAGVGANFQRRLKTMIDVDVPWTADVLEQRMGRIVRQGNQNEEVEIIRVVTKESFDALSWQIVSRKAGMISQGMSGNLHDREIEDIGGTYLSAQEALAATSGNPLVGEKIRLEAEIRALRRKEGAYRQQQYQAASEASSQESKAAYRRAVAADIRSLLPLVEKDFRFTLYPDVVGVRAKAPEGATFAERGKPLFDAVERAFGQAKTLPEASKAYIGEFRGFKVWARRSDDFLFYGLDKPGDPDFQTHSDSTAYGSSPEGVVQALTYKVDEKIAEKHAATYDEEAARLEAKARGLRTKKWGSFEDGDALRAKEARLAEVNEELDVDKKKDAQANGSGDAESDDEAFQARGQEDAAELQAADAAADEVADGPDEVADDEPPPQRRPPAAGAPPPPDEPPPPPPPGPPDPGDDGWDRKVRGAKARNARRARGGSANAGIDPAHAGDLAIEGADLVLRGFRSFRRWSAEMTRLFGRVITDLDKLLVGLWRVVRQMFDRRSRAPKLPPEGPGGGAGGIRPETPPFDSYRKPEGPGIPRKRVAWEKSPPTPEEMAGAAEAGARTGEPGAPEPGKPPSRAFNTERLGSEEGIREWQMREEAYWRGRLKNVRSYRSWAEARTAAVRAGLSEGDFIRLVKKYGAVPDNVIEAGRSMREELARSSVVKQEALKALQERLKTADAEARPRLEEEIVEADRDYRVELSRWLAVTSATVEAGSEVGRALAIHRHLAEALTPHERWFRGLLRRSPNLSEKQMTALADAVMRKDAARIMELSRSAFKPKMLERINEWFINSLLSGPSTLAANLVSNTVWEGGVRGTERGIAAGLEKGPRQAIERLFGHDPVKGPQRFSREMEEAFRAHATLLAGWPRALKLAWQYGIHEPALLEAKGEFRPPAIGGVLGKIVRTPSRLMYALDQGARFAAEEAELGVQAIRAAMRESQRSGGWTRDQATRRMKEIEGDIRRYRELEARRRAGELLDEPEAKFLAQRPDLGAMARAIANSGSVGTFTDRPGRLASALIQMREAHPWMTLFAPFIATPSRILHQALVRSPYGAYDVLRKAKAGELKGGELSDEMAKVVFGNVLGAGLYLLARQGFITGSGPADPDEARVWRDTGKTPYAVKLGDTWVSMARIEPVATTLGWAADLAETQDSKTAGRAYDKLMQSIALNIAGKTYLQGLTNLAEAVGDPERYGPLMMRRLAGAFVPNLLAAGARAIDPLVRETPGVAETLASRIPILSETLPARHSGTGEEIRRGEDAVSRFASPFRYSTEAGPEKNLERIFIDVGYIPSQPPRTMAVPGANGLRAETSPEERQLYATYARRATEYARGLAQNESFTSLPPLQQEEVLRRLYRFAHDRSRRAMVGSLIQRAQAGGVKWVQR